MHWFDHSANWRLIERSTTTASKNFHCNRVILFSVCCVSTLYENRNTWSGPGPLCPSHSFTTMLQGQWKISNSENRNRTISLCLQKTRHQRTTLNATIVHFSPRPSTEKVEITLEMTIYMLGKIVLKPKHVEKKKYKKYTLASITAWKMKMVRLLVNRNNQPKFPKVAWPMLWADFSFDHMATAKKKTKTKLPTQCAY